MENQASKYQNNKKPVKEKRSKTEDFTKRLIVY